MPSPLGRVAPKGPGEVRYNFPSISVFRRIRTVYRPLPTSLRSATFPKGEGFWRNSIFYMPKPGLLFFRQAGSLFYTSMITGRIMGLRLVVL